MTQEINRRGFFGLVVATSLASLAPDLARANPPSPSHLPSEAALLWQKRLYHKRRSIRNLYLHFHTQSTTTRNSTGSGSSRDWLRSGFNELFYTPRKCAIVAHRGHVHLTEFVTATRFFQKVEYSNEDRPDEVLFDGGRGKRKTPAGSLASFYPTLKNVLTLTAEPEEIHGEPHLVFTQAGKRYWLSPSLGAIRLETSYNGLNEIGEEREFHEYFYLLQNLAFPAKVRSLLFNGQPEPIRVETLEIMQAIANQPFVSSPLGFEEWPNEK